MAQVIGNVTFLVGTVIAVDASGNERQLNLGDAVYLGERIITQGADSQVMIGLENGESFTMGRSSEAILDQDLLDLSNYAIEDELAKAELLQRKILENPDFDLSQLDATAAGGEAGTGFKSVPVVLTHDYDFEYSSDFNDTALGFGSSEQNEGLDTRGISSELELTADPTISSPNQFSVSEDTVFAGQFTAEDPDGGAVTFDLITEPSNGVISLDANGQFTYTPNADFNGSDSIAIQVTDSQGSQTTQVININVTPVDDAPRAEDTNDLGNINEGSISDFDLTELFTEADGEDVTVSLQDGETLPNGLEINEQGQLVGTPDVPGDYQFVIVGTDESGNSVETTVSLTVVEAVNDETLATAGDLNETVDEDAAITINAAAEFSDEDQDALNYALEAGSALPNGLTLNADGTITGSVSVPGDYSFTITATDPNGGAPATKVINLTVNEAVNDETLATAGDLNETADEDAAITINAAAEFSDEDQDALDYALEAGSDLPNGLTLNADGTITGSVSVPGDYSFTITATDPNGGEPATKVINLTINEAVNDAAEITVTAADTNVVEDTEPTASGTITIFDEDAGEGSLASSTATYGTVSVDASGNWTYTLDNGNAAVQALGEGETLTDTIVFTSDDGTTKSQTVTITGSNDAANITVTATDTNVVEDGDATATGTVTITDTDTGENTLA
ncbi:retention module-containing protein, partial [Litoribrevibacter euphylliae]